jgi:hypothetical protein
LLGLPLWLWILIALVVLAGVYVGRFRKMCASVREDLTELLEKQHPQARVLREEMGNLVVHVPDGTERVWEMADIYSSVARLPGLGCDRSQRAGIYHQALAALMAPSGTGPLRIPEHGRWIKPRLLPADATWGLESDAGIIRVPMQDLGLVKLYVLDLPDAQRHLTERDLADLGIDLPELDRLAVENLGKQFPQDMVASALAGSGSAVQFQDSFDAARLLLLPSMLQEGQELIALIPHRDMLLLLPPDTAADPEKLREGLRELKCAEHPELLDQPVRVTRSGFSLIDG